jgi:aryl-alcohol dehydrogenase-like predicted oxidoreductase
MKLALGTAQFGLDYGVSNKNGKISQQEINNILDFSQRNNLNTLDTASGYGDSEKAIGSAKKVLTSPLEIITKISTKEYFPTSYEQQLTLSLASLQSSSVYAVMLHNADDLLSNNAEQKYRNLKLLKNKGLCKKIGVSVYHPEQLITIINNFAIDIIQIPLNIFDQRFSDPKIRLLVEEQQIEIHARSLFLQGLLLMEKKQRPNSFDPYSSAFEALS